MKLEFQSCLGHVDYGRACTNGKKKMSSVVMAIRNKMKINEIKEMSQDVLCTPFSVLFCFFLTAEVVVTF